MTLRPLLSSPMRPWWIFFLAFLASRALLAPTVDTLTPRKYFHPINVVEGLLLAPLWDASMTRRVIHVVCATVLYVSCVEGLRRAWHCSRLIGGSILAMLVLKSLGGWLVLMGDPGVVMRPLHYDVYGPPAEHDIRRAIEPVFLAYQDLFFRLGSVAVSPLVVAGAFVIEFFTRGPRLAGLPLITRQRPCPKCEHPVSVSADHCRLCGADFGQLGPWEFERAAGGTAVQEQVRALVSAVDEYRTETGTLPETLARLMSPAPNPRGEPVGPFLNALPSRLSGWSAYGYTARPNGTFAVTVSGPWGTVVGSPDGVTFSRG